MASRYNEKRLCSERGLPYPDKAIARERFPGKGVNVSNSEMDGRTRVSIESMEERQPIYTGFRGALT